MKSGSCAAVWIVLVILCSTAQAQETQVPFDSTGKIQQINSELEQDLHLFPEYQDFQEAKLYRLTDSTYVLELYYKDKAEIIKDRRPLSADEASSLRARV